MKLYHISLNPRLTTLIPKKPKNGWVEYGIEDGVTKRVSFSPTIMGCVRGVDDYDGKGEVYYVYVPTSINQKYIIHPTMRQVPDVNYTHEVWYTKPVNVKRVGAIKISGATSYKLIPIIKEGGRLRMAVFNYKYRNIKGEPDTDKQKQSAKEWIKNTLANRLANYYSRH